MNKEPTVYPTDLSVYSQNTVIYHRKIPSVCTATTREY